MSAFAAVRRTRTLGSAERRLLSAALDVRGPLVLERPLDALNWPALVRTARDAKILPLLARRVLAGSSGPSDPHTRAALRESLQQTAAYNTRLLAELARAAAILREAGIEHVALKGAVLIARHYPNAGMRHTVDFDLLIDPVRFDDALARLRAAGYAGAAHTQRLAPDGRQLNETLPSLAYACAPLKAKSGVNADLHHLLPVSGFAASGGFRGLLARSEAVSVHGVTVRMCHALDLALHLCEHFALQHHADPLDAPRLLSDLRVLFPGEPPWSKLQAGPPRQRLSIAIARGLYDAAFSREGARGPLVRLLRRVAVADPAVLPVLAQISNLRGHTARIADDLVRRPRYALRTFVPTRAYLAERYAVDPRSPRIYPLYASRLLIAALRPWWPWR